MFVAENTTGALAECFQATDKHCRKHCVVVIRASFDVDTDGACTLSGAQTPFTYADTHYGEPETTAVQAECDFVPIKPRAEVLLDAQAVSPGGLAAEEVEVALLGPGIDKRARVIGPRQWFRGGIGISASRPAAFQTMPLAWHLAFGGSDHSRRSHPRTDPRNPVGRGYLETADPDAIAGTLLPSIEDPKSPVTSWTDRPMPVGFGPVPRFAEARARYAGTYDQHWIDNVLPFLPDDFDDRYFQSAPEDQQLDALRPGLAFACLNMSASGVFRVRLPQFSVPVRFHFTDGVKGATAEPDTLIMQPHLNRVVLLGRASIPLPRRFTRLKQITVGRRMQSDAS